jgi:hypothetical protein
MNRPYIKVYEEERELTVMLLIDVSGSRNFGTVSQMKRDTMTEVAATLAFSTIENNDKVGVIFFSDQVEKFIPPKKGKSHVLHIIRELLSFEPEHTGTNINAALQYLTNAQKRRCAAFLISDFIDVQFDKVQSTKGEVAPVVIAARKHDLNAIQIYDRRDAEIPNVGLLKVRDPETGARVWADTSLASVRNAYGQAWKDQQAALDYMTVDYEKYSKEWGSAYDARTQLIKEFVDNYGLTVSEENADTLKELVTNGSLVTDKQKKQNAVDKICKNMKFERADEYQYAAVVKNTTDFNFKTFQVRVNLLDKDDVIVESTYASVNNWEAGQKAKFDFWYDGDFEKISVKSDYWDAE